MTEITAADIREAVHVLPEYGKPHDVTAECWCRPEVEDHRDGDGGSLLFIHREQN